MKKTISLFFILMIASLVVHAQDLSLYQKKWMVQGNDTLPYRILLPLDYNSTKKYPVIFFLHGAGERGRDNEKHLTHGGKLFLKEDLRAAYQSIIVFPQCPTSDYWGNVLRVHDDKGNRTFTFLEDGNPGRYMFLTMELVKFILKSYPAKMDQVYVGGLSMGGMGTFELVRRMPEIFAAAFPICGGANPATASKMKKVNWWIFHGAKDNVMPPFHSENMFKVLKAVGSNVKFTLFPNANHNSWDSAFAEPELLSWLFLQKKK